VIGDLCHVLQRRRVLELTHSLSHRSQPTPMSADLPALLLASLQPHSRQQAESSLNALSQQPGFAVALLRLVLSTAGVDRPVRLAGVVYLKNLVMMRWEEVCLVPQLSRETVLIYDHLAIWYRIGYKPPPRNRQSDSPRRARTGLDSPLQLSG
jgi:hypothetical protein